MYYPTSAGYLEGDIAFEFTRGLLVLSIAGDCGTKHYFKASGFY